MIVSYTLCKHYKDLFKVFFFGVWAVVFEFNTKNAHLYGCKQLAFYYS